MIVAVLWLCLAALFVVACIVTNPFVWAALFALGVTVLFMDLSTNTPGRRR